MPVENLNPRANREAALNLILNNFGVDLRDVTYPTLSSLRNRVTENQTEIKWGATVGGTTTKRKRAVADAIRDTTAATEPAKLPIGEYAISHNFTLNLVQIQQAAQRGATQEVRRLVETHINDALTEISRDFNSLIFTGTGVAADAEVVGFLNILKPSYAYGTLVNPRWQCVRSRAATNFSATDFYAHERLLSEAGLTYSAITCHPKFAETYKGLFDTRRTFATTGVTNVDLGLGDLTFNGRPIIQDMNCPDSLVIFRDDSKISVNSMAVPDDALVDGLRFKAAELATRTAYGQEWELGILPQLVVRDRRAVSAIALNAVGRALVELA